MPHKYDEKMFDIKHLRETAEKLKRSCCKKKFYKINAYFPMIAI